MPNYDTWISNAVVFEFPRDDEITKVVRIDPIVLKNYNHDKSAKWEYFLEIGIVLLSLVMLIFKFTVNVKSMNPRALSILFSSLILVALLVLAVVLDHNFYQEISPDFEDFGQFRKICNNKMIAKWLMILGFLMHS